MSTLRHATTHTLPVLGAVLAAALAGGCATTAAGQLDRVTLAPAAWSTTGEGVVTGSAGDLSRWWERLGDRELSSLIERALAGSVDLRTAQARLRQARAQWKIAGADRAPAVSASASPSVSDTSKSEARSLFSAGIDASWEPDVFGGDRRGRVQAAAADLAATEDDLYNMQVSLAAEVALNYVDAAPLPGAARHRAANLASQSETLQLTEWRAQAGLVTERGRGAGQRANLEQTAAQVPVARDEHRAGRAPARRAARPSRRASLAAELSARAAIPGRPGSRSWSASRPTRCGSGPTCGPPSSGIIAETARLGAERAAAQYPSFNLSGLARPRASRPGALTAEPRSSPRWWAASFQTIFDGGRIRRADRRSRPRSRSRRVAGYESTVLTALEDVENALVALDEEPRAAGCARQRGRGGATRPRSLAQPVRGRAGGLPDGARHRADGAVGRGQPRDRRQADRTSAVIRLYKALGGGWSPDRRPRP